MKLDHLSPSVTDERTFKDHLLGRTLPLRALTQQTSTVWLKSLSPQYHHGAACHFKTISWA